MEKFTTNNKFRSKEIEMGNTLAKWGFEIKELNDGGNIFHHDRYFASDFQMVTQDGKKVNVSFKALDGNKAQNKAFAMRNIINKEIKANSYWFEDGLVKVTNSYTQSQVNLFYKIARLFTAENKSVKLTNYFEKSTALWSMVKYGSEEINQELFQPDYYIIRTNEGYRVYKDFQPIFESIVIYKKPSANKTHETDLTYFTSDGEEKGLMLQFNINEKMLLECEYVELEDVFI